MSAIGLNGDCESSSTCPICGSEIPVTVRFTSSYDDRSGAWEGDVEFVGEPECPNKCELSSHQRDIVLVYASAQCG